MRKLILGLIIGLLIGTVGTALASTDYVRATFSEFKLKVNGESIELENNPLLVEGTTYWPIRELSGYLGFDIDYEDETRTILVDTPIQAEEGDLMPVTDEEIDVSEYNTHQEITDAINAFQTVINFNRDKLKSGGFTDEQQEEIEWIISRAEDRVNALTEKLLNFSPEPSEPEKPAHDPFGTVEDIESRLWWVRSEIESTTVIINAINSSIATDRENGVDVTERLKQLEFYENQMLELETEKATLEAKLKQLQ